MNPIKITNHLVNHIINIVEGLTNGVHMKLWWAKVDHRFHSRNPKGGRLVGKLLGIGWIHHTFLHYMMLCIEIDSTGTKSILGVLQQFKISGLTYNMIVLKDTIG